MYFSKSLLEPLIGPKGDLWLWREDLSHPHMEGGKGRKLKGYMALAHQRGASEVITVGGPHSRHLVAVALMAADYGLKAAGYIKHRYLEGPLTPALREATSAGMTLHGLGDHEVRALWDKGPCGPDRQGRFFIPPGGLGAYGLEGYRTLADELQQSWNTTTGAGPLPRQIYLAAGTGMAALGIAWALGDATTVWALPCYGPLPRAFFALAGRLGINHRLRLLKPLNPRRFYRGEVDDSPPPLLGRHWEIAYDRPLIEWLLSDASIKAQEQGPGLVVVSGRPPSGGFRSQSQNKTYTCALSPPLVIDMPNHQEHL